MKSSHSPEQLLKMLQKPAEIFAGVMPIGRALYTPILYLRRCRRSDVAELHELMLNNRDYLNKWIQPQPKAISLGCVTHLIAEDHRLVRKGQRLDLGIFRIDDNKMLGRIALHSVDYGIQRSAGLSYWIDKKESGKGYITKALATLISFAFEECCLHRIWLEIANKNKASLAVAKKLGFVYEGINRKSLFIDLEWQDASTFSMLDSEYDELADSWLNKGYLGS